jgi:ABC-2 type transport system permease protein
MMFEWNRVWLVARRELTTRFKQRTYVWGTIVQAVIVALVPLGIAWFTGDDAPDPGPTVAVVDEAHAGVVDRLTPYLGEDETAMKLIAVPDAVNARTLVDDGEVDAALIVVPGQDGELAFRIATESGDESSGDARRVAEVVAALTTGDRMAKLGLTPEEANSLFAAPNISHESTSEQDDAAPESGPTGAEIALAYIGVILIFGSIFQYGSWITQGVAEEKSSRIMEIMVNAATPRDLLAGKVIGIMLAALVQTVPMLVAGGAVFAAQPWIADLVGGDRSELPAIDFGELMTTAVLWFMVYFLLGFLLYAALFAAVGSLVSRQEEVGQAMGPVTLVIMMCYLAGFVTLTVPESRFAIVSNYIPFLSPFAGISRVLLADPPIGEMLASVVILAITGVALMWFAARLYRVGVLMYGQRPGWRALMTMRGVQEVAR